MATLFTSTTALHASEADLKIPPLDTVQFSALGGISGITLMDFGIVVCAVGAIFGLAQYFQTKKLPVHESMGDVSRMIWETCKTYLFQQGKFLAALWFLIATCIFCYFKILEGQIRWVMLPSSLVASVFGILGSYGVAWFGIRVNTIANSRTAFAALMGKPVGIVRIPLRSGMSIGLLLVCVELFFMISILIFLPRELVGLLHRLCDRRITRCERTPHRRRHLHQDRGHRQRLDEDRLQAAGG